MDKGTIIAVATDFAKAHETAHAVKNSLNTLWALGAYWVSDEDKKILNAAFEVIERIKRTSGERDALKYIEAEERKEERGTAQ